MRVDRFLESSREISPEKTALVCGSERLTYRELDARSNRLARALRHGGVERGDRVVLFLDSSVEAVVSIFGVLKADAVFSPVNASTKADKLTYLLNNCRATAIVTEFGLQDEVVAATAKAPSVRLVLVARAAKAPEWPGWRDFEAACAVESDETPPKAALDIDLAMLIYTSGSTGSPKGVMMTHQNISTAAQSITTYLRNRAEDVLLCALPLSFDYGLYQVLMSAFMGAKLVLERSFRFPWVVFEKMKAERVTGFPLVPTMAALILQMKDLTPGFLPDVRYLTNTAAALPPAHIERLRRLFPQAAVYSMYGLTECKRCTYLEPDELAARPTSVGKAIPNTEAWIVNEHGEQVRPGEVGELVIRGGHVMQGYWEDPAATRQKLRPSGRYPWERVLYTGDMFRQDDQGYLYFVARTDDIIKTRGEKVSPKEVENALYSLEGIKEAAVIGVPDPVLGEAIKAVVVLGDGVVLSARDVIAHCQQHLETFMVPKEVEFRHELPKTSTGKIRRREVHVIPREGETSS